MPTLYVTIGIPASGKTTWRSNYLDNYTLLSPDAVLEEKYNYEWSPVAAADAWNVTYQALGRAIVSECFNADSSEAEYVWDACNPTPRDRSAVLNIAKGAGWRVVAVYFNTPREVCDERNEARPRHRKVPEIQMDRFWANLTPPQDTEAWDDCIYITHGED